MTDKKFLHSKKIKIVLTGIVSVLVVFTGVVYQSDPNVAMVATAAIGAIGAMVSVACGAQGAVDFKSQSNHEDLSR